MIEVPLSIRFDELFQASETGGVEARRRLCDVSSLRTHSSYRGISLVRNNPPVGPYSRAMPRAL
jgi:hypothetical protein